MEGHVQGYTDSSRGIGFELVTPAPDPHSNHCPILPLEAGLPPRTPLTYYPSGIGLLTRIAYSFHLDRHCAHPSPEEGRTYPLLWFGTLDSLENSGTPARVGVLRKRVTSVLICVGHLQQNVFQSDPIFQSGGHSNPLTQGRIC